VVPETCAVIPVYNHEHAVAAVVTGVRSAGLTSLLVDDGSSPACAAVLDALAASDPLVSVLHLPRNLGKGGAVAAGLREAAARGYSHALQIDADGQHDTADIPRFLEASRAAPEAVVCGRPVFDASIPRVRYYARYLTHVLVWLNTLSFDVRDAMCGFRVYPIGSLVALLDEERPGERMDFDIEVLVRLHWRGVPMVWLDTRVGYPRDGVSHFRLGLDNLLISRMHALLFLGMLRRLPRILARPLRRAR
jgi:glycosyltransferase involved in cell wall biosynthesis